MYEYRQLTPEQRAELVEQRLVRGFPPHEPPHPLRDQLFYLLTAACYEHKCHLNSECRRQEILDLLFEAFANCGMEFRAWVVLPNHYHLLVKMNNNGVEAPTTNSFKELGKIFRSIHGSTSHQWNQEDSAKGRKVWYRYSDRAIRSERHYYTTINYIHYNPVKHGWSKSPYDWTQSSVHWYLQHYGRQWLRDSWLTYPVQDYGKDWDNSENLISS